MRSCKHDGCTFHTFPWFESFKKITLLLWLQNSRSYCVAFRRNFASTKAASLRLLLLHSEVRGALDEEEEEEEEEEAEAEEVT
jgi:hypothetical protein